MAVADHIPLSELIARMLPSRQWGNPEWKAAEDVLAGAGLAVVPTELLEALTDSEECSFDHHGGCQTHGYLSLEPGEHCPQAEARELLATLTESEAGDDRA
jgi:hypothetical protein